MQIQERTQDLLLPYINDKQALKALQQDGYYVLKGVLSRKDSQKYVEGLWDYVENANPKIIRNYPETWYKSKDGLRDPWPATWGGSLFHSNGVGWCQTSCDIREQVAPVFEQLFGTKKLHCSRDGFNFTRPPRDESETFNGEYVQVHFDQGSFTRGLTCVQGSVCLVDQEEGDGCFVCVPGSHKLHDEIMNEAVKKGQNLDGHNFYNLSVSEQQKFDVNGLKLKRIYVQAGDMILWRSDLAHAGSFAQIVSDRFRAVVFVCMLPVELTPTESWQKKEQAWQQLRTTTHWPNKEIWFGPKNNMRVFNQVQRPKLNQRQKQLFGLEWYEEG
eukprot:TRINITY_DN7727_c2_g1_i2.p1 TRINITY_DN7727_c2_g1~~TRINITY_DN7727_c2_g1_i2.p1  ORF type:complete len:329 (-),score=40.42 TRINITY_DN7727_c2_g1_i2:87-1073(-)